MPREPAALTSACGAASEGSFRQLLLGVSAISTLFVLTLYVQQVLGYTPLQASPAYLPLAGSVSAATVISNQLVPRGGPRPVAVLDLATAAARMPRLAHSPWAATTPHPRLWRAGLSELQPPLVEGHPVAVDPVLGGEPAVRGSGRRERVVGLGGRRDTDPR